MKRDRIIFWSATGIISLMMVFSAYSYFFNPEVKSGFVHLGFPDYFRAELGIAKLLGAFALLLPFIPVKAKEFAYSGFAITFISAAIAHIASGDPTPMIVTPFVMLGILAVSYVYLLKTQNA